MGREVWQNCTKVLEILSAGVIGKAVRRSAMLQSKPCCMSHIGPDGATTGFLMKMAPIQSHLQVSLPPTLLLPCGLDCASQVIWIVQSLRLNPQDCSSLV